MGLTILQNMVTAINGLSNAFTAGKSRITGTFTLAAAATTSVTQVAVQATSAIGLTPLNASAAMLMGSAKSLYLSVRSPGVGFTVATADGTNAVGTERFSFTVFNP